MPICPKCHKFKKKSVYNRHMKGCIPIRREIEHYLKSKSGKHDKNCTCSKCKKRAKIKKKR